MKNLSTPLTPEKIREFRNQSDRLQVLYDAIGAGRITVDEFGTLLEHHEAETQYQISLDSFD